MAINSKRKGKRGELEFCHELKKHGIKARRGVQYQGTPDSPDVVSDLENIHFEIKRTERINIYAAMSQSINDAGDKTPVVAHRRNRSDWLITMRLEDWIKWQKKLNQKE